jgi:chromatin structure-remodeling complex subunit SFH1
MAAVNVNRINAPQAFVSSYAPRIRNYGNSLLTPVQPQLAIPPIRTTKRGTTAINYAEEFEDDSIDDSDGPRRQTGLRTAQQRRDVEAEAAKAAQKELGREAHAPVDVQGIWREWMGKPKRILTERQMNTQSALPTTLVPIRIDLEVPPFRPEAALPTPNNAKDFGIDENLPAYKAPEPTSQFRLKDSFLWNLHEALITPDQFAKTFVDELDFPAMRKQGMVIDIANQIRQQLEEHAATALHPLFQPSAVNPPQQVTNAPTPAAQAPISREDSGTPIQADTPSLLQPPQTNGGQPTSDPPTPMPNGATTPALAVTAQPLPQTSNVNNPPETHRCVLTLSINLQNRLYTDKFEWSLLHPPGFPEIFAKQTCADMGLSGEWVPSMAHAIYEASLRLKKEMIENGGTLAGVVGSGVDGWGVLDNEACEYHGTAESAIGVGAGWRFDEDGLGLDWEPKIEVLSKEEIERREGDRERQLRRARRETARFTTTYTLQAQSSAINDYFSGGLGSSFQANGGGEDERMGRGERSKKKRRFRSLSPVGRETPEVAGFGGTSGQLTEGERQYWHCSHCRVWGSAVWGVRDGPHGPRVSQVHMFVMTILLTLWITDPLQQLWPALRTRQTPTFVELQPLPQ